MNETETEQKHDESHIHQSGQSETDIARSTSVLLDDEETQIEGQRLSDSFKWYNTTTMETPQTLTARTNASLLSEKTDLETPSHILEHENDENNSKHMPLSDTANKTSSIRASPSQKKLQAIVDHDTNTSREDITRKLLAISEEFKHVFHNALNDENAEHDVFNTLLHDLVGMSALAAGRVSSASSPKKRKR